MTDEQIREAADMFENSLLDTLPKSNTCQHTFSPEFERKMKRVIRKANYNTVYCVLQRVACILIAVALCGSMLLLLNTNVQAVVIDWVKEKFSFFTSYFFAGDSSNNPHKAYTVGWLPEEYTILDQTDLPDGGTAIYVDTNGQILQFSYSYDTNESSFHIGEESFTYHQVTVSKYRADLYLAEDPSHSNGLVWVGENGTVLFQLTAFCDEETLLQIAESVCEIQK